MNPDVAAAVLRLARGGVLTAEQARPLGRVARGELVSVRPELRLLLYGGVLAVMGGVGLLVQQNLDRIGPLTIAIALSAGALGALAWALRHAPPFSWGPSSSVHLAFDYILLLGVLLTGAALAYIELNFTALGANWSYHLLVMSLFAAVLAVRGDSRVVASIALTTFAAWRGVSSSPLERGFWSGALRVNAIVTGLFFVVLGIGLVRSGRKAHFEPVAMHLGWLLVLAAIFSGIGQSGPPGTAFRLGLFVVGAGLAGVAFGLGRFPLFGMGLIAAYIGLSALLVTAVREPFLIFVWFSGTGIAMLVCLLLAHKAIRGRE
jgi:hypothetical protein